MTNSTAISRKLIKVDKKQKLSLYYEIKKQKLSLYYEINTIKLNEENWSLYMMRKGHQFLRLLKINKKLKKLAND